MQTYLQRLPLLLWARYVYIAAIIISLIGILPVAWFPLQLGKLVAGVSLMFLAGLLFILGGGIGNVMTHKQGNRAAWLVLLLPISYLLSYGVSSDRSVGLLGYSLETDTLAFVAVASIAFLLSFFLFRRLGSIRLLLVGVGVTAVVGIIFQFISIFFGTRVVPAVFSNPSINLVGKWNDLGLLVGVLTLMLVVTLASSRMSLVKRVGAGVLALVSVLFLALVQFPLIWGLLLAFSILLGAWLFIVRKHPESPSSLPWVAIGTGVVSILLLLWGAAVGGGLTKVFPVTSFEVRPSFTTSLDIIRASHGSSVKEFVVGTGPNTFSNSWFSHKPAVINQSQFWNLDFNVGYSTFITALGTVGVLGALAWCVPLLLVLIGLIRVVRNPGLFNWYEQTTAVSAAFVSIFLGVAMLFYPPSESIILLMYALAGASFAFAMKNDISAETAAAPARMHRVWQVAALVVLALVGTIGYYTFRRYNTEVHVNKGIVALSANDTLTALNEANAALASERTGDSLQFATQAGVTALQQIIQTSKNPSTEVQQQFASLAQTTITTGKQATEVNPSDYRAHLWLARTYDVLAGVGVEGAYDQAKQFYASAAKINPTNPAIPLALARLQAVRGDARGTTDALKQALTLKPDYTDAILFAVQLYVADKDINNAILAAKAAVNSAPGVPSIWFELGLLYYSANDMKDAAVAFEQAVKLQTDYANAKYFLGLSYAALGKSAEAIQQFRDLAVTNPDNSEVKLILSNLEAGKPPFNGATPPVTSTPQDRATAPISQ